MTISATSAASVPVSTAVIAGVHVLARKATISRIECSI
jgi:hypothetical protein